MNILSQNDQVSDYHFCEYHKNTVRTSSYDFPEEVLS